MYKDLGLAMEVAKVAGKNILPVGSTVYDIYGHLVQQGYCHHLVPFVSHSLRRYGSKDFGVVYQPLASDEGLQSPLQREVEQLREENRFLITISLFKKSHRKLREELSRQKK